MSNKEVFLGEVCNIATGQSAPQAKDAFTSDGIPFIRAGSLKGLLTGKPETEFEKINQVDAKKYRLKLFPKDTIIFAKSGMSAKIGLVYRLKMDCYLVSHLAALTPKDQIDSGYLQRWFQKNSPSNLIANDAYPSIKTSEIQKVKIPLPPLEEQKRIAAILDKADTLRRKREKAIALTNDLLRATFLDMFGDPVTNPKGLPTVKFSKVGQLDRGKSKHRPRNDPILLGGDHPLIQTGDIAKSGGYITGFKSTYSDIGLKQSKKWSAGTLCITIAANIANTGILEFDACFPDSVVGFKPNKLVTVEYVQTWLGFLQKIVEDAAPESAQKNINLAILRDLEIPLADIQKQNDFSNIVLHLKKTKAGFVNSKIETDSLFSSLSEAAFRGELNE